MSKFIQRNMAAGEITPELNSRSDIVPYKNGLSTCRNFYVRRQGSVTRRPGTEFLAEVKDSSKKTRIIEFEFSNEDTFILEFGDQYIRFHTNGETVLDDPFLVTDAETGVNPIFTSAESLSVGQELVIDAIYIDANGIARGIRNRNVRVSEVTVGGFRVVDLFGNQVDTTGLGTFNPGFSVFSSIYEIGSPFLEEDIFGVRYTQSADFITLTHFNRGVFNLARIGNNNWTFQQTFFQPSLSTNITGSFNVNPDPGGSTGFFNYRYIITQIDAATGEESFGAFFDANTIEPITDLQTFITVDFSSATFTQASGIEVAAFNIYRSFYFLDTGGTPPVDGDFLASGFMATVLPTVVESGGNVTYTGTFSDDSSIAPDFSRKPPGPSFIYGSVLRPGNVVGDVQAALVGLHPTAVTTSKGRRFFGGPLLAREDVFGSAVSRYDDFSEPTASAALATSALSFQVTSEKVGRVLHLVDYKRLMIFTETAEFVAQGGESGSISGSGLPNTEKISEDGTGELRPIIADKNVLYVQARGSLVKFVGGSITIDDYQGNELSILSAHLVDGFELVDWTYQRTPHGIVWAVRDDGVVLSLTYNPNQNINGWARHDFLNGKAESIANVPEGNSDRTYFVVNREINGQTKRYIESFDTEYVPELEDMKFMDCHLSFDGQNTDTSRQITVSAADYTRPSLITLSSNDGTLTPITNRVGQSIFIQVGDEEVRFDIIEQVPNAAEVRAIANRNVPASIQGVTTSNWAIGLKEVVGLDHLEGQNVSVLADGFVSASPLNEDYNLVTVSNGSVQLDNPAVKIHIGLANIADVGTLDIDGESRTDSLDNQNLNPQYIALKVRDSASFFAGEDLPPDSTPLQGLREAKVRRFESYNTPNRLRDGLVEVNIESEYEQGGRVFVRQVDPLPLTILSIGIDGKF